MVSPTCFGITLPSSGSVPSAFWEMLNWGAVGRILWMGVLCVVTWRVVTRNTYTTLSTHGVSKASSEEASAYYLNVVCVYTGWSKRLFAPDDYNTLGYLAQSDCLAADRQGQGDTRLTLTPSVILNSNHVFMVNDWNCFKYFWVFFGAVIIRCTDTFWSLCNMIVYFNDGKSHFSY
jgi:hypothetical protein